MKAMKSAAPSVRSQEIELKLALPASDAARLAAQLARSPALARRKASQQSLHNIYYDTSEQTLRQQRVALRVRRAGSAAQPRWLQTLKTGGRGDSALSQRGEWEVALPGAALSRKALKATPWSGLDPDGSVFAALAPCFETSFERTCWRVRRRDGSVVEVALDIGQIIAGDARAPICELELELLAGAPAALFELARQLAASVAVLPLSASKAERGYALAQGRLDRPLYAQPPLLSPDLPLAQAARRVLREMFSQFTSNLNALRRSDEPELVHQARVGWRRFRSALRLFRPVLANDAPPSWAPLQALLSCLGHMRDLDVALNETLPPWAGAYAAGEARRLEAWQAMLGQLEAAATLQRKAVRYALREPALGACLLAFTQWLEGSAASAAPEPETKLALRPWARQRIRRLQRQLKRARQDSATPERQHRVRILAKRLRYGIEALQPLLTKRRGQRWYQQATDLQSRIGATRDVGQAAALVAQLEVERGLVEFLRGLAAGLERPG
jgi:inorganic triphosphatase YgiF